MSLEWIPKQIRKPIGESSALVFWDPIDIAWVAGVYEGEGSLAFIKHKDGSQRYPSIRIAMCDKDIIERLQTVTGVGVISLRAARTERHKEQWNWMVNKRKDVARVLLAIAPLLGERRKARVFDAANAIHVSWNSPLAHRGNRVLP